MLNSTYITKRVIRDIARHWIYSEDLPKNFKEDYKKLFREYPPDSYD